MVEHFANVLNVERSTGIMSDLELESVCEFLEVRRKLFPTSEAFRAQPSLHCRAEIVNGAR